jgi:hypothetical protein
VEHPTEQIRALTLGPAPLDRLLGSAPSSLTRAAVETVTLDHLWRLPDSDFWVTLGHMTGVFEWANTSSDFENGSSLSLEANIPYCGRAS